MNDFVGVPLSLGDSVIFIAPRYRHLVVGKIVAFTPKNVRVSYINTWNFGPTGLACEILQDSLQLVRIEGNKQ